MTNKEDSAFLQELESRLDSLFGEDTKPVEAKGPVAPQADTEGDTVSVKTEESRFSGVFGEDTKPAKEEEPGVSQADMEGTTVSVKTENTWAMEDNREAPTIEETNRETEVVADELSAQDQFQPTVAEIDKSFLEIFGDDEKHRAAQETAKETEDMAAIVQAAQEEGKVSDLPAIENLKSIVLSLEWEINNRILQQLEDESNKLYLLHPGDRIAQGLLRILRFIGRYLQVKGESSNQDSVNLLLSVYDHLENVMVSEGMTEAEKNDHLSESIKQYRYWVERTDLESSAGTQAAETFLHESRTLEMEPPEDKFHEEQEWKETPLADIHMDEEKPSAEAEIDKAADEEAFRPELEQEQVDKIELVTKEQEPLVQPPPISMDEMQPAYNGDVERTMETIKDLPPHEAFAYALEELKKTFQTEIDALKEEIRFLKNNR